MRNYGKFFQITFSCAVLALGGAGLAQAADIRIGGGAAPMENIFKRIAAPLEQETGITLRLSQEGPPQAWKNLDEGKVDAATAGMTIQDWADMMEASGYRVDRKQYIAQIIGMDSVKIYTNKDVEIPVMNKQQVKGIFSGTITNWKELGGPDLPIVVVLGTKIQGTMSEFKKKILEDSDYTDQAVEVETAADIKRTVIGTPGAIGIGTKAQIDDSVNAPRYPEPARAITLITKVNRPAEIDKIVQYILGPGKQLVL